MIEKFKREGVTDILFDAGGVLMDWRPDFEELSRAFGVEDAETREKLERVYMENRSEYDRILTADEYWDLVEREMGVTLDLEVRKALQRKDMIDWAPEFPEMVGFAKELKEAGFRLWLLSNAPAGFASTCRNASWAPYFSGLFFSYEYQLVKPDPEIFRRTLAKMYAQPEQVLFFDDSLPNVESARAVGMHALQWSNLEEMKANLQ